jgi:hypothetical protein
MIRKLKISPENKNNVEDTYNYSVAVNGNYCTKVTGHQELIEYIEQIRVERGEGAKYSIQIDKI